MAANKDTISNMDQNVHVDGYCLEKQILHLIYACVHACVELHFQLLKNKDEFTLNSLEIIMLLSLTNSQNKHISRFEILLSSAEKNQGLYVMTCQESTDLDFQTFKTASTIHKLLWGLYVLFKDLYIESVWLLTCYSSFWLLQNK